VKFTGGNAEGGLVPISVALLLEVGDGRTEGWRLSVVASAVLTRSGNDVIPVTLWWP